MQLYSIKYFSGLGESFIYRPCWHHTIANPTNIYFSETGTLGALALTASGTARNPHKALYFKGLWGLVKTKISRQQPRRPMGGPPQHQPKIPPPYHQKLIHRSPLPTPILPRNATLLHIARFHRVALTTTIIPCNRPQNTPFHVRVQDHAIHHINSEKSAQRKRRLISINLLQILDKVHFVIQYIA